MTNATFHVDGRGGSAKLGEFDFQIDGRYSTLGKVVRIWTDSLLGDVTTPRVLVVSDPDHPERRHGAYEVFQDRGVYQIMAGVEPKTFSVLAVLNTSAIAGVHIDDEVTIAGDYGEIHYRSGSAGSLPDMGLFICSVANVQRTRPSPASPAP